MADVTARNNKASQAAERGRQGSEQASQSTVGKAISTAGTALGVYGQVMGFAGQQSEKTLMPIYQALSFMQGIACLPASSHLDPVIGIDVHMVIIPPSPSPIPMPHPYIAVIMDPKDWLSCAVMTVAAMAAPTPTGDADADAAASLAFNIGTMALGMAGMSATVKLGGFSPRTVTGVKNKVVPHFPMGASFALPTKKNEGHAQFGSLFLVADSCPFTGLMHPNNNCWDIGLMQLVRKQYKPAPGQLFMPTGFVMAIPSHNVIINPIPTPVNPVAALTKMLNAGFAKAARKVTSKMPAGVRNALDRAICHVTGHPVDVVSGMLFTDEEDFSLPGVIPLSWERVWFSDSHYKGPLGHGWYHKYDARLSIDKQTNHAIYRLNDGRGVGFELPQRGKFTFDRKEKLFLHCHVEEGFYYIVDKEGLTYRFTEQRYFDEKSKMNWGLLSGISNNNGYSIRFEYSANGLLQKIIDSADRILAVENDKAGRIVRILAPHPSLQNETFAIAQYNYDEAGNMICHTDAVGKQMRFEYENHLLVKETWRNGMNWFFVYDGKNIGAKCVHTWGDDNIYNHKLTYSQGITQVENSLGDTTTYYHKNGLPYTKIDGNGAEWGYRYNKHNELEWETDPLGNQQSYSHDEWGNVVTTADAGGGFTSTEYYNPRFPLLPTEAMDAGGGKWKWEYDEDGNIIRQKNPLGAVTKYSYEDGLLTKIVNAAEAVTHLRYDKDQNLASIQTDDGAVTEYGYDALGNCTAITNPNGVKQRRIFDLKARIEKVHDFDGNVIHLEYDGVDNVVRYTDKQKEVEYTYRGLWKLTSRTEAGATINFVYDTEEQLRRVVNEHGLPYRFNLDAAGNVVEEIGFDNITRQYTRNAAGWVTKVARPANKFTSYDYDACGRVTNVLYSDGKKEEYSYRPDGDLMQAINESATVQFERDVSGNILKEIVNGEWITSEYDWFSNRIKATSSLGADINHRYSKMGDVMQTEANGWLANFGYDKLGLETERNLPGGISSRWQRDGIGRPVLQEVGHTAGAIFNRRKQKQYTWDVNDRLKQIRDEKGTTKFEHDAWSNLAKTIFPNGEQQLRNPDAVGNLYKTEDRKDREYAKGGQLRKAGGWHYSYDVEGNLIKKEHVGGDVWLYEWNDAGMLTKVVRPDKDEVSFAYDALGRRLWKRYKNTTTKFVWDGSVPLHEWKEHAVTGEKLSDLAVGENGLTTWLFDTDSFAPCGKIKGEKKYSIVTDHLGTPAQMYREDGGLFWEGELDSYGKMRVEKGEVGSCPFRYQGQYEDVETGLYYNRFRYYAIEQGMYISQDPINLAGGMALYHYAIDTNFWIDALGLSTYTNKKITKKDGGSKKDDFINEHAYKRHKYDASKKSSKSKTQYGKDVNVKAIRQETLKKGTATKLYDEHGNHYATRYSHTFSDNISTPDTPTNKSTVIINHVDPSRSTQFPYAK